MKQVPSRLPKCRPDELATALAASLFVTWLLTRVKLVRASPNRPSLALLVISMLLNDTSRVVCRLIPVLVAFWIVPPVQLAALVQEPPAPVTVRPPLAPVLFRMRPVAAP